MRCSLGLLLALLAISSGCMRIKAFPEEPGLYVLGDAGDAQRLTPLDKFPDSEDELEEMINANAIRSISPSTRFILFSPDSTIDDVRNGLWMNIGFTYFDPGATGGKLGPEIRSLDRRKGLWELSFPQLSSMRSCILSLSWDLGGDSDTKDGGIAWVDGLSPEFASTPRSLFDVENYEKQMMSSIAAEHSYSFGEEISLRIPREKAVRLKCTEDHPSNVREILIYPCDERLYIRAAFPPFGCAPTAPACGERSEEPAMHCETSQTRLSSRAHGTTIGPTYTLRIEAMWDYDSEFVELRLRTRTFEGTPM